MRSMGSALLDMLGMLDVAGGAGISAVEDGSKEREKRGNRPRVLRPPPRHRPGGELSCCPAVPGWSGGAIGGWRWWRRYWVVGERSVLGQ